MQYSISVPIGAWNDLLPETIRSLARQSADVQIALLDASNDARVASVADEFDHLLAYRRHGPDLGQSDAILEGWQNTDGDILGWLNADDSLFPRAMQLASDRLLQDPTLDVVYGHSSIIDGEGRLLGYHHNVAPPSDFLYESCIISQPSCFFRREAYDRVGGLNRDLHYVMDWDLWLRLYSDEAKFGFINEPMSRVLWDERTKSASFNVKRRSELKSLIETYAPAGKRNEILRAYAIHAYADMIWPTPLKNRVLRHLRRSGPKVFGLRADGCLLPTTDLHLVHYQEHSATKVLLALDGDPQNLTIAEGDKGLDYIIHANHIELSLAQPVSAGQHITLRIGGIIVQA